MCERFHFILSVLRSDLEGGVGALRSGERYILKNLLNYSVEASSTNIFHTAIHLVVTTSQQILEEEEIEEKCTW